ncbi:MAG: DUF2461 domain-containing protein [Lentimicrobiaceae bacterium]|nr:DUF2461 domain-containing protein [Lentimicrobiaceae bacterium]
MTTINPETLLFLTELKKNNQRDWFQAHKAMYDKVRKNYEDFARVLLENLQSFDPTLQNLELKQCTYRIYRDVRFSPNKEPYKTHLGVYIAKNGRNAGFAGYYFHLDPEESFFGGGIYMPLPEYLKAIRKEIYYQINEFKAILNAPAFKKYYPHGIDEMEKLKKAPVDFPKDFSEIELLKNKHFFSSHYYSSQDATKEDFIGFVINGFKAAKPLVDFINFTVENNV